VAPVNADLRRRACHTQEIPYVFGNLEEGAGYESTDRALAERMMSHWIGFATDADPGGGWPLFTGPDGPVMHFDRECGLRGAPQGTVFETLRRRRAAKTVSASR
jgi:carboxylesterase type B